MRSFGSDNHSGVHPTIMAALSAANGDHCPAYGDDPWSAGAVTRLQQIFGTDTDVRFVFNGTGANVYAVASMLHGYESVLCSAVSHLYIDEAGAPEAATGCKLIPIPTLNGKLTTELLAEYIGHPGNPHATQSKVVSITQSNEYGLVYSTDEIKALTEFAHRNNLLVHMDGARISNAAVALGCDLRQASRDLGVDVLSLGGTKNGLMFGECVLFFNGSRFPAAPFQRKRVTQLASKMRFIAAQFLAYLDNDLWRTNAAHANSMATRLANALDGLPGVNLSRPVQSNMVWAKLDPQLCSHLQKKHVFYLPQGEARFVTSFDTTEQDIELFAASIREYSESSV